MNTRQSNSDHRKSLRRSWRSASPLTKLSVIFTGVIAASTVGYSFFSGWQLYEIHTGGEETHKIADAAVKAASAAYAALEESRRQFDLSRADKVEDDIESKRRFDAGLNQSKEELAVTQRARLVFAATPRLDGEFGGEPFKLTVLATNTGRSPAERLRVGQGLKTTFDSRTPESPIDTSVSEADTVLFEVGPGITAEIKMFWKTPSGSTEEKEAVLKGTRLLRVEGLVQYGDVFTPLYPPEYYCYWYDAFTKAFTPCPKRDARLGIPTAPHEKSKGGK